MFKAGFTLDLTVERYYAKDAIRAVLHSILFHRTFTLTKPEEEDLDAFDITFARAADEDFEAVISAKIADFMREMGNGSSKGGVSVMFYEKKQKPKYWFGGRADEDSCWEQWVINVTLVNPRSEREQLEARKLVQKQLQTALLRISQKTNEEKDHVPPITNNEPFPFQILIVPNAEIPWGMGGMLKQISGFLPS
ncbi:autophagy-related protein [Cladochytrium replicatum]|nr:autophagy-related protein [Cladochytrium replicatum]